MQRSPFISSLIGLALAAVTDLSASPAISADIGKRVNGCRLGSDDSNIEHVIYLIFDNVHFRRDNPSVPSDLEQMPNLLSFIRDNGTLLINDHTVLISHTANGILTDLMGVYPDRHGQAVANSYRYFKADGTTASSSSFKYWTDSVDGGNPATSPPTASADSKPNMISDDT